MFQVVSEKNIGRLRLRQVFIETVIAGFPRGYVTFEPGGRRRTTGKIVSSFYEFEAT